MSAIDRNATQQRLSLKALGEYVVVLSPHLDDAIFSLAAAIANATREGARVRVVTVFAGDPESSRPCGDWDTRAGFSTVGEAARARRLEDARACRLVGAEPIWLPYPDEEQGEPPGEKEVRGALSSAVDGADAVLVPGFPLAHHDHEWLATLIRSLELAPKRIISYLEQPYALFHSVRYPPTPPDGRRWLTLRSKPSDKLTKLMACRSYRSQLRLLGGLRTFAKVIGSEISKGGELVLTDSSD